MAKRGRPAKATPVTEETPVAVEEPTAEITKSDKDFLEKVSIGVSGLTPEAVVIGGDPKFIYRQSSDKKVDYNKSRGYEPVDKERILGPHSGSDGRKHGDTLLMRCDRRIVEERNKLREGMAASRVEKLTRHSERGAGIVGGGVKVIQGRNG